MKIRKTLAFFLVSMCLYSNSYALDGTGTVEEMMVCTGVQSWTSVGLFKLSDGNWFGTYLNMTTSSDLDESAIYATVLSAFTTGKQVTVKANYTTATACGVSATFLWDTTGDYVKVHN